MSTRFKLEDSADARDLEAFLKRAKRLDKDGAVRLKAFGALLTATVAPIYGNSILGTDPTVMGMRTSRLIQESDLDAVVSISSVLERLARNEEGLELPVSREVVSWAGVSAPQTGWERVGSVQEVEVSEVARLGIAEVASAIPGSIGASIAQKVRSEVWGSYFSDYQIRKGAAFALSGLGFLTPNCEIEVFRNGTWLRLSTAYGQVLTKN